MHAGVSIVMPCGWDTDAVVRALQARGVEAPDTGPNLTATPYRMEGNERYTIWVIHRYDRPVRPSALAGYFDAAVQARATDTDDDVTIEATPDETEAPAMAWLRKNWRKVVWGLVFATVLAVVVIKRDVVAGLIARKKPVA